MVCVFSSLFSILCCCVVTQSSASSSHHPTFLRNDTYFEHLALHPDPKLGRVYLGARDRLYQLSFDLQLEAEEETGPVIDSRDCLPPISDTNCPQAKWTNNHNKLLLVDPYSQELISCGSVYQGICQKRSLDSVGKVLFSAERPVDTQYVAANDPNVSTVGLVALTRGRGKQQPVLFVGRGYTNSQPPISTRNLVMEPVFSYEETSKLAVAGRLSEYDHHFVTSFTHRSYVYFMFYRRDLQSPSRDYRTYVSRMCLDDTAYYSYVEVPLSCRSAGGKNYNLLQALHVGIPNRPNEESAVCVFSLEEVDKRIDATRDLCYTEMGRADGQEVAYIEYEVKSNCANLPTNTLDAYPCGSDHTPSPMASRALVEAEPIFDSPSVRLTAVAVSVREEHTIAFLGDSQGNLHKVEEYAVISIHPSAPISRELRLDRQENHLYILTKKRSVAECEKHLDCQSCLLAHDPYCGWCVLEGKCGLRIECVRGDQKDQWLWSFDIEQQCLSVTFLNPSNISREERRIISLSIPGLPSLERGEHYSCVFQDRSSLAVVTESGVTCSSPHVYTLPSVSPSQGENIVMCLDALSFICSCHGCVQSRWGCNWCVNQHMCTHKAVCDKGLIIYNEHVSTFVNLGASACPCVEKIQGSSLLPVLTQRKISLLARNFLFCLYCNYVLTEFLCVLSISVTLYNCSVGHLDCSRCHTADQKYNCVWCGASCVYRESCSQHIEMTCPAPLIHLVEPLSGLVEGGITLTVSGSNLGQKAQDILQSVTVAGVPCTVIPHLYEISSRILCTTTASGEEKSGHISVKVSGGGFGLSSQRFSYQDPKLIEVSPQRGPKAGGTTLTITGRKLLTGRVTDISVLLGNVPCSLISSVQEETIKCLTGASNRTGEHRVTVRYGNTERHLHGNGYYYTPDPNITHAIPSKSFVGGGRVISVFGQNLDVVQKPQMRVTVVLPDSIYPLSRRRRRRKRSVTDFEEDCEVKTSSLLLCRTPGVDAKVVGGHMLVEFLLDNLRFDFNSVSQSPFIYEPNPVLHPLNHRDPTKPYRYKPGSVISVEGENLDLAIFKEEVVALIGEGVCTVKTLTHNHLYCEPPPQQPPLSLSVSVCFQVHMGNLNFSLGQVQYDSPSHSIFPLVAQIGVGVVASLVALIVLIIVFIYRRKSKQALRDYKKVQIQLENLETSVRDRCKKEFTDLMTEMMDMTSDLVGSGIPFLEYRMYAERIFFPGHRESPLCRDLDVQECRRATVEQGLIQLSNLLNSKLFLTKFIHTLESQRTFSPRDRGYVASLLTVALHSKLEYFTDILKTLLNDLVEQYIAKNPKLMLRRTETVVEKLLTNWISICLYAFLRHSAGESLYMLFRAIKHQVDKGPVDAVTGKAKYTLNDNRLLREDLEYRTLTLNVLMQGIGVNEAQPVAAKVLDCDTITQVKEKILDQVYKGTSYSHRPHADSVDLEWRSGVAGHLILSDEDLTSVVHGNWKRLNTLQHYKVPDGANVALVLRQSKHIHHDTHDYFAGEKTPMLEDADEGGVRLWHLVKASEEPELPKHRRGSLKERERAKTIPEIYLTRLLSMKGTLQKFVDDLFTVILSTSQPVPLAIKYFFDLLDDQAVRHGISDSETIHIWKTNSLPLRFWINIVKNPQFIFDVQVSDNVDAVLSVIAQTFMDSCTTTEHKLGRDSPINKLLYARDIPRYKQMVERYYADIKQTISANDQEMNSALAELSRNYSGELNYLVALHELYKYINKYYDQIITALEEDTTAQKMQLGYRLQQIAAAVENKVTDL
uniref:Plexin-B1 n=1 Tax=Sinocyclocheilus anshuiensis TaxID=1608454 RepID=A0A671KPC3_9TELE